MSTSPAEIRVESSPDTARNLGFWVYLMSDCIIFSMLFVTFVDLSTHYAGGPTAEEIFALPIVFLETMVLLMSSLTYGLAMVAMERADEKRVKQYLLVTFFFGACFIGMELYEFVELVAEGAGPTRSAFLSGFFALVGTHGAHVTFGLIWIATMVFQVQRKGLTPDVASRITRLSMFWHFLDVVWIAVFSTVYLAGMAQ